MRQYSHDIISKSYENQRKINIEIRRGSKIMENDIEINKNLDHSKRTLT